MYHRRLHGNVVVGGGSQTTGVCRNLRTISSSNIASFYRTRPVAYQVSYSSNSHITISLTLLIIILVLVTCPICSKSLQEEDINHHLDISCSDSIGSQTQKNIVSSEQVNGARTSSLNVAPIFSRGVATGRNITECATKVESFVDSNSKKRSAESGPSSAGHHSTPKRAKTSNLKVTIDSSTPLAERLRPSDLSGFVGQSQLTGPDSLLLGRLDRGSTLGSIVFWGPPGCGKTTLARLLAKKVDAVLKELSATMVGINDVRSVVEEARRTLALTGRKTILFLDEVHRFNKSQQDIFLPYLEQGIVQFIGATTENPSFKLTSALLSRCRVFTLNKLTDQNIRDIVTNAIHRVAESWQPDCPVEFQTVPSSSQTIIEDDELENGSQTLATPVTQGIGQPLHTPFPQISEKVTAAIVSMAGGDARTALSLLELAISSPSDISQPTLLASLRQSVVVSYDRTGESHYDMISALHKSVRGSKGSAAMYWLARMLSGGEDPMYIARRMVVCASEDIGLADAHALPLAIATMTACEKIGMPECRINLAHLVAYLSEAPKSTRAYEAYKCAEEAVKDDPTAPVPMGMRNAPTRLMKELGYSKGYNYNPDYQHPVHNEYTPTHIKNSVFLVKEGDLKDKIWDAEALSIWETEENGGQEWEGRKI